MIIIIVFVIYNIGTGYYLHNPKYWLTRSNDPLHPENRWFYLTLPLNVSKYPRHERLSDENTNTGIYFFDMCICVGLFQKAIMQSGNMLDSWALNEKHREAAFGLAKHFGCDKSDANEIVRYLRTVPAMDLIKYSNLEVCTCRSLWDIRFKVDYIIYIFGPGYNGLT